MEGGQSATRSSSSIAVIPHFRHQGETPDQESCCWSPHAHSLRRTSIRTPAGMEKDSSEADPSRQRNGLVCALYGEFTDALNHRVRYSVSLTESALSVRRSSPSPGRTQVVFNLTDCVGCRAHRGPDGADVGAYFTAYFYPFRRRWMSAGVARQRVEQCFRVALVQDPLANLQEAERWARAIRDASALQAPRRHGEHHGEHQAELRQMHLQLYITVKLRQAAKSVRY